MSQRIIFKIFVAAVLGIIILNSLIFASAIALIITLLVVVFIFIRNLILKFIKEEPIKKYRADSPSARDMKDVTPDK